MQNILSKNIGNTFWLIKLQSMKKKYMHTNKICIDIEKKK